MFFDVDFINGTGLAVYGCGDEACFDFRLAEDAGTAIIQVNNALSLNNPLPTGASSAGTSQYFIPAIEYFGLWAAFGGQFFSGVPGWDACEQPECASGLAVLRTDDVLTYAKFTEVTEECTGNEDCDDDLFCNGQETCVEGQCEDGPAPCIEGEICNEETNSCEAVPQPCECDLNNDGVCDMLDFFLFGQDWGSTDCPIQ
jgi:hypothetical protein